MRLIHCHIENFGILHDMDMEFTEGLNTYLAENGSGKSTLLSFLLVMFYGFEGEKKRSALESERKRFEPWQGGVYGGSVTFEVNGRIYEVTRTFADKQAKDTLEIMDLTRNLPVKDLPENLGETVFGIDRNSFVRSLFIFQKDITTSVTDGISAKISRMTEETDDMVSYEKASELLKDSLNRMTPNRITGSLAKMNAGIRNMEMEVSRLSAVPVTLEERKKVLAEQEKHIAGLEKQKSEREKKERQLQELVPSLGDITVRETYRKDIRDKEKEAENFRSKFPGIVPIPADIDKYLRKCLYVNKCYEDFTHKDETVKRLEQEAAVRKQQIALEKEQLGDEPAVTMSGMILLGLGLVVILSGILAGMMLKSFSMPLRIVLSAGVALLGLAGILEGIVLMMRYRRQRDEYAVRKKHLDDLIGKDQVNDPLAIAHAERKIAGERYLASREEVEKYLRSLGIRAAGDLYEQLHELRDQADDYWDAERDVRAAAERLKAFEKDHPLKEGVTAALTGQIDEVRKEIAEYNRNIELEKKRKDQYLKEIEELQGTADDRIEKEAQLISLREKKKRLEDRYAWTLKARELLEEAHQNITARFTDPVVKGFAHYYAVLTKENAPVSSEAYHMDAENNMSVMQMGRYRSLETLSRGLQDLTGFCLRLAYVDAMYPQDKPVLFLDDPFTELDDHKMERVRSLLDKVGEDHQILYFTCSKSRY